MMQLRSSEEACDSNAFPPLPHLCACEHTTQLGYHTPLPSILLETAPSPQAGYGAVAMVFLLTPQNWLILCLWLHPTVWRSPQVHLPHLPTSPDLECLIKQVCKTSPSSQQRREPTSIVCTLWTTQLCFVFYLLLVGIWYTRVLPKVCWKYKFGDDVWHSSWDAAWDACTPHWSTWV